MIILRTNYCEQLDVYQISLIAVGGSLDYGEESPSRIINTVAISRNELRFNLKTFRPGLTASLTSVKLFKRTFIFSGDKILEKIVKRQRVP